MKVNQVNSTNFQGLYAAPETLKKIGCTKEMLLMNPQIKKCAKEYDVLVTASPKKYVIDRHDGFTKDKYLPAAYLLGVIWGAPHLGEFLNLLGINNFETMLGTAAGLLGLAGLSIIKLVTQRLHEIHIQGASKVEKPENININSIYNEQYMPKGATTLVYTARRTPDGFINITDKSDMAEKIRETEYKCFHYGCLKDVKIDDMYTPSKYLNELQKILKSAEEFHIKDVFKFPINKSGDTLLTTFFDVAIPDKSDTKEMKAYYKILQEISKTDKSNFDKSDSHGIPIIEKIMNSENIYILPMIKGCKFSYSPFLKYTYDNIQDQIFKEQLRRTIDFNFELLESKNK